MSNYQVIVGNIGTIGEYPNNPVEALRIYGVYKRQSISDQGRAGGETVTLLRDGEVEFEHVGSVDNE